MASDDHLGAARWRTVWNDRNLPALKQALHGALEVDPLIVISLLRSPLHEQRWGIVSGPWLRGGPLSLLGHGVDEGEEDIVGRAGKERRVSTLSGTIRPFSQCSLMVSPMRARFAFLRVKRRPLASAASPFSAFGRLR